MFAIVKDVFLPWYNAYRFLVQNVQRWEQTTGKTFQPSQVYTRFPAVSTRCETAHPSRNTTIITVLFGGKDAGG